MLNSSHSIDYLEDILKQVNFLTGRLKNETIESFLADQTLILACERSIEIIGEAVKNLPAELKDQYPDIEWRKIAQMRDRLVHQYFVVDYGIMWNTATQSVPELKTPIEQMLKNLNDQNGADE